MVPAIVARSTWAQRLAEHTTITPGIAKRASLENISPFLKSQPRAGSGDIGWPLTSSLAVHTVLQINLARLPQFHQRISYPRLVTDPAFLAHDPEPVKAQSSICHSNMRSSYYGKVESSCSGPAHWPNERTGDVGVKHERSGSVEGVAGSEGRAFDAAGGSAVVGDQ